MSSVHLLSPKGFRAGAVYAGIKSKQTPDVGLLICDRVASAAASFTKNKVVSPAVTVGRDHVRRGQLRGIVVNAGNANACTGSQGKKDALRMCHLASLVANCPARQFLPSSTGIIGHLLPMQKIEHGILAAGQSLGGSEEHAQLFGGAIMTTDTKRKQAAVQFSIGKTKITLAGVCKGSGMIGPRLSTSPPHATMLAYLTTDAQVSPVFLRKSLQSACDQSFNCVTVDDHASTNDTACILASGMSQARIDTSRAQASFSDALNEVTRSLAYQIAADGEGATKVVAVHVINAKTQVAATAMARTIANSPLVKCAMHGNDPNWGRIVSAAGYADVPFDPDRCILNLQGTIVFRAGKPMLFDADKVSQSMNAPEIKLELDCKMGRARATFFTCDLSKDYITINADYHT